MRCLSGFFVFVRMSILATCLIAILPPAAAFAQDSAAEAPEIEFEQAGVYVLVDDLAAAKSFYSNLLGLEPVFENPVFVGFYIEGGLFAVASRAQFSPDSAIERCRICE